MTQSQISGSEDGMVMIPAGSFAMGSQDFYPEEAPVRQVSVDAFLIDRHLVTNRDFTAFVASTDYRTVAERTPDAADYPGMDPELAVPGSLVFFKPPGPVDMGDPSNWWRYVPGACWRSPSGPGSSTDGLEDHPVVHVAWADAVAFADWAGKDLPTEAQWEYAARGGRVGGGYAWGEVLAPEGAMMANYWQGLFPFANLALDGWEGTSPVGAFPPNAYGAYDLIGNVWEWTQDLWTEGRGRRQAKQCCGAKRAGAHAARVGAACNGGGPEIASRVLKGGSHLCAENYCQRYRPAARHPETVDSATTHIGFRCVRNLRSNREARPFGRQSRSPRPRRG